MKFERHEGSRKLTPSLSKLEAMLNLPERAQPARILVQRASKFSEYLLLLICRGQRTQ